MNRLLTVVPVLALLLTGCTQPQPVGETPESSQSVKDDYIVLHAPGTAAEESTVTLVIESAGHDNETVQLYGFPTDFDVPTSCTDTTIRPKPIALTGGSQQVTVSTGQRGEIYWIITGQGVQTSCGDLKTIILANVYPDTGIGDKPLTAGKEFSYFIGAQPPKNVTVTVSVTWIGPFKTAPEAQASPCAVNPVLFVDEVKITATTGITEENKNSKPGVTVKRSIVDPGIYRVMIDVPATSSTAEFHTACEDSALVTVE